MSAKATAKQATADNLSPPWPRDKRGCATFSSGDVGGELLPRRGAGEAGLEGGAEQEELVVRGEGKGRERSHQTLDSSGTRAGVGLDKGVRSEGEAGSNQPLRAVGDVQGGSSGNARVRRRRVCLEREGDRPISAVAATRKRNASMEEGEGPCKCTSSVYATTRMSGNVRWTFSRASCRVRAKKRGPQDPPADPPLGGEGGRLGGRPPDDEEPVGPVRPGGKGEEPRRLTSDRLQQGLLGNAVESVLEVKLQGHVLGAAGKACAERMAHALASPWDADAEL
jgi:hypothetical protein